MADLSHATSALAAADPQRQPVVIGRYLLHRQIARGGMATIHIGRLVGDEGFTRIVAAKRLHPQFAEDADFVAMFLDEARIASKVHHRNVVPVLDVVATGEEVVLVQDYVHGAPLHWLLRTAHEGKTHVPLNVAVAIACGVLAGLQAAHETTDELGEPLGVVHRDVSPQNIMVATDGTARLLDFGIAKASMASHVTREGVFKGKLAYSSPEQIRAAATQQSDVYSLAVVLWELIVGQRLHHGAMSEIDLVQEIMRGITPPITEALAAEKDWLGPNRWRQLEVLDPILRRGLAVEPSERWKTAADMEAALSSAVAPATPTAVAQWLKQLGKEFLAQRDHMISAEEASWRRTGAANETRRAAAIAGIGRRSAVDLDTKTRPHAHDRLTTQEQAEALRQKRLKLAIAGASAVLLGLLVVWLARSPNAGDAGAVGPGAAPAAALPAVSLVPAAGAATIQSPAIQSPTIESRAIISRTIKSPASQGLAPRVDPAASAAAATSGGNAALAAQPASSLPSASASASAASAWSSASASHVATNRAPPPRWRTAKPAVAPIRTATTTAATAPAVAVQPPTAPVAAATATTGSDATDCNPPYYFEGKKKVFKPACI